MFSRFSLVLMGIANLHTCTQSRGNHMFRKIFILIRFVLGVHFIFGQTVPKPANVLPPSPEAYAIAKYGGINVGLQTGTPQVEIPLFNLTSKNISLPISLSYASNGIKVDEIASRVGTSWILNAGGVISRSVIDDPDESATPLAPPADFTMNAALMTYLKTSTGNVNEDWDNSPDIFSFNFNGNSGKFIVNGSNVVPISRTNLKIERPGAGWSFKITDAQGIAYYFGSLNSIEYSKSYVIGTEGCGKSHADFVATSWYLGKIVHPDGDAIELSYQPCEQYTYAVGVSQTSTKLAYVEQFPCNGTKTCYYFSDNECESMSTVKAVYLSQIKTSENTIIKFQYTTRKDLPKDYLLENVLIYTPTDTVTPFKSYKLGYYNAEATATNSYSNQDPTLKQRPFLTQVQEFNKQRSGSLNYLLDYINMNGLAARLTCGQDHYGYYNGAGNYQLLPKPKAFANIFPGASANREPNFDFAQRGLLGKITYPTGGYDEFSYAPAAVYVTEPSTTELTISASTIGTGTSTPVTKLSEPLTMTATQIARMGASFYYGGPADEEDFHAQTIVEVYNTATNQIIFSELLNADHREAIQDLTLEANKQYRVRVTSYGQYSQGSGVLHYTKQEMVSYNKQSGGAVISQIKTIDPVAQKNTIKKLLYSRLNDPDKSSGTITFAPVYVTDFYNIENCGSVDCGSTCRYKVLHSSPVNNLYGFSQHHIYFSSVIESFGADFENGGIEHRFEVEPDQPGEIKLGSDILSSPLSNFGAKNGLEIFRNTFIKRNGTIIPLTQTRTTYKVDARLGETYYGYTVQKKYEPLCLHTTPLPSDFEAFDVKKHYIISKWIYADTVETKNFDKDGLNPLVEKLVYSYENPAHLMQTKIETSDSKGNLLVTRLKYPQDIDKSTLDAASAAAIDSLIKRHSSGLVIESEKYSNTRFLTATRTNYQHFGNGIVKPKNIQYRQLANPLETHILFNQYNAAGSLQEQQKSNDVKEVYFWGYNGQYPVAKIVGADHVTVKQYINQSILDNPATTDAQMRAHLQNLRINLPGALITTYTYAPLVGITSQTDVNNRTTYYEYDSFGRLMLIRDQDGNILKKICYNYAGMPGVCDVPGNVAKSQTFTKAGCNTAAAQYGSSVTYSVDANTYFGTTQAEADAKAQAEIDANGQAKANAIGQCLQGAFNVSRSAVFTRQTCNANETPGTVTYTVPAGKYLAATQAAADQLAAADLASNGQRIANETGTCTPVQNVTINIASAFSYLPRVHKVEFLQNGTVMQSVNFPIVRNGSTPITLPAGSYTMRFTITSSGMISNAYTYILAAGNVWIQEWVKAAGISVINTGTITFSNGTTYTLTASDLL